MTWTISDHDSVAAALTRVREPAVPPGRTLPRPAVPGWQGRATRPRRQQVDRHGCWRWPAASGMPTAGPATSWKTATLPFPPADRSTTTTRSRPSGGRCRTGRVSRQRRPTWTLTRIFRAQAWPFRAGSARSTGGVLTEVRPEGLRRCATGRGRNIRRRPQVFPVGAHPVGWRSRRAETPLREFTSRATRPAAGEATSR